MKVLKKGGHHLFSPDENVARIVSEALADAREHGMDAIRKVSRERDGWDPPSFELSPEQICEADEQIPEGIRQDIAFCQEQVRGFAQRQLETMKPLEVETLPGVVLGHKHIPVRSVGCWVPGGRYPLVASAYMSILAAKVAGVETVVAATPPIKGNGWNPVVIYSMHTSGADRIFCVDGASRELVQE